MQDRRAERQVRRLRGERDGHLLSCCWERMGEGWEGRRRGRGAGRDDWMER